MRISIRKLVAWGPGKTTADVEFGYPSHLVYGPTDTGKSYIVQCIRYCLGSNDRPEDIGWSSGYVRLALQITSIDTNTDFTLFRSLIDDSATAFLGHHDIVPQMAGFQCEESPEEIVLRLSHGSNRRVITKAGKLSNLTADSLRHISIFDEIETLERVPLEGADKILKMRNRSVIALVLSGVDDSSATLVPTADKRNIAKGYAEALAQERELLIGGIPQGLTQAEAAQALVKVSTELENLNIFLRQNAEELESLKRQQATIDRALVGHQAQLVAFQEGLERFRLLDSKYESDRERLSAIDQAAKIVGVMETRRCPLCLTDFAHQARHSADPHYDWVASAAKVEYSKIDRLQSELQLAIDDLNRDIKFESGRIEELQAAARSNQEAQTSLLSPKISAARQDVLSFVNRRSELSMAIRDFERLESLQNRLDAAGKKAKRQKQKLERDIASSANSVCRRVHELLSDWNVPGVEAVSFDESVGDIRINERRRVSFGKGKRGIFLTAYVVSLMEHALDSGTPHLGLVVVDSPVVTYRDPKHGSSDPEEALDESVKDRFYEWLAYRGGKGQVIVLENEEPESGLRSRLSHTEFVGSAGASGRKGFYPS
jgi:hypothetical protein